MLDYSILVGIDEENMELVVGIIDLMRQYDILKQMERVGKSLPMVVGSEAPMLLRERERERERVYPNEQTFLDKKVMIVPVLESPPRDVWTRVPLGDAIRMEESLRRSIQTFAV